MSSLEEYLLLKLYPAACGIEYFVGKRAGLVFWSIIEVRSLWDGLLGFALSHRYVPSLVSALRVYIPNACVFQTL